MEIKPCQVRPIGPTVIESNRATHCEVGASGTGTDPASWRASAARNFRSCWLDQISNYKFRLWNGKGPPPPSIPPQKKKGPYFLVWVG